MAALIKLVGLCAAFMRGAAQYRGFTIVGDYKLVKLQLRMPFSGAHDRQVPIHMGEVGR